MNLRTALFWACLVATCGAELLVLRAAFFPPSDAERAPTVPRSPRVVEMIWGVIPAVVLAVIFVVAWRGL
jgi:heme/copper-type cytochrome/quinol oxidase subunit 2